MTTQISNNWIVLDTQRNGVELQRKFAGLETYINEFDEVEYCRVKYWEREMYPNGDVIKTELKWYSLEDLPYTEVDIEGVLKYMDALPVLSGFIAQLGSPGIISPARETLANTVILPVTTTNGYPLRRDTRVKNDVIV